MKRRLLVALLSPVVVLGGCAGDNVLFVTGTNFGVKAASQPTPTLNAGLGRVEGYVAPVYQTGEIPPIAASFQKVGKSLDAGINQTYATGLAAHKLTGGTVAAATPQQVNGVAASRSGANPAGARRRTAFVGSTTSIGMKVGYTTGSAGPIPERFSVGYDRFEYSLIPLTNVGGQEVYPSVFMSIAANMGVRTDAARRDLPGIDSSQIIATGTAAENVITQGVRDAFASAAVKTTRHSVSAAGVADAVTQRSNFEKIAEHVAPGGVLDSDKLKDLYGRAKDKCPGVLNEGVQNATDLEDLRVKLGSAQPPARCLASAISADA